MTDVYTDPKKFYTARLAVNKISHPIEGEKAPADHLIKVLPV